MCSLMRPCRSLAGIAMSRRSSSASAPPRLEGMYFSPAAANLRSSLMSPVELLEDAFGDLVSYPLREPAWRDLSSIWFR